MNAALHLPVLTDEHVRPVTRGDCEGGERPCPWVSCVHHTIHGVMLGEGGRTLTDDELLERIEAMPASCTLDVADAGDATLEEVGDLWGVTRERIRQMEAKALKRVRRPASDLAADLSDDELPASVPAPKRVPAARIDWMGEGEDPAEADTAPAAMGAEETAVGDQKMTGGAQITTPAAGARCIANGCVDPPQGYRESLDPLLRPLCKRHRLLAQTERTKRRCSTQEAVAIILRRAAASNGCESAPPAPEAPLPVAFDAPVVEALGESEVDRLARLLGESQARATVTREESAWLLSQRDAARAEVEELRRDRDAALAELAQAREKAETEARGLAQHLDARDARIAELEGQLLADATSREPAPRPLARLAALARVLVPGSDAISWMVERDGEGSRWGASVRASSGSHDAEWEAEADDPDEALAALIGVLEAEAHARIEALNAALGGGR